MPAYFIVDKILCRPYGEDFHTRRKRDPSRLAQYLVTNLTELSRLLRRLRRVLLI